MIKLIYNNTKKGRFNSYKAMQLVAEDVLHANKRINRITNQDNLLPCPKSQEDKPYGIANCSELWFGTGKKGEVIDIQVMEGRTILLYPKDKNLKLLFMLTCISLCEQFCYTKFETDEDFTEAVELYQDMYGTIPPNAAKSLGREEVV